MNFPSGARQRAADTRKRNRRGARPAYLSMQLETVELLHSSPGTQPGTTRRPVRRREFISLNVLNLLVALVGPEHTDRLIVFSSPNK